MGSAWSRWLESDGAAFNKTRHIDAVAQRLFYASLKLTAAAVEGSIADENAETFEADATAEGDESRLAQLQYVLENWAREVGVLYDRVGDFPLILPLTRELHAAGEDELVRASNQQQTMLPKSRDELLLKATSNDQSATSDQLYVAMYRLANKLPQDEFLRIVAAYPRATRLFVSQAIHAQTDVEAPFRLWISTGQYTNAACHVGKLAYGEDAFVKKMGRLQEMAALLQRAQDAPTGTPQEQANASFHRVMTEEMIELIDAQNRLENRLGVMHLVGGSVIETVNKLLTLFPTVPTALSTAVAFGEDFHVHPTQFWWCLIRIFSATDQWCTLFALSGAVPPPCGYTPIAEALVDAQHTELAPDLLASISVAKERDAIAAYLAAQTRVQGDAQAYGYVEDDDAPVVV